jgi:hypothetical protein
MYYINHEDMFTAGNPLEHLKLLFGSLHFDHTNPSRCILGIAKTARQTAFVNAFLNAFLNEV